MKKTTMLKASAFVFATALMGGSAIAQTTSTQTDRSMGATAQERQAQQAYEGQTYPTTKDDQKRHGKDHAKDRSKDHSTMDHRGRPTTSGANGSMDSTTEGSTRDSGSMNGTTGANSRDSSDSTRTR